MSEQLTRRPEDLRDAVCIHTQKVTDSCRDKDCIEDLRVYLTRESQSLLDACAGAKARCAELLYAYIDVEPVAFNRNHYCIDITFYYRILADAIIGDSRPATLYGLAVFSKRAVLCGEDSCAKIFTSDTVLGDMDGRTRRSFNHPTAVVEVLDPMILSARVRDVCDCPCSEPCLNQLPVAIRNMFEDELVLSGESRRLYVTLGQFSIIRLERDVQLLVPTYDYCIPTKECCDSPGCAEDPCDMFSRINFPVNQFFPQGCACNPGQEPACECSGGCSSGGCGYKTSGD